MDFNHDNDSLCFDDRNLSLSHMENLLKFQHETYPSQYFFFGGRGCWTLSLLQNKRQQEGFSVEGQLCLFVHSSGDGIPKWTSLNRSRGVPRWTRLNRSGVGGRGGSPYGRVGEGARGFQREPGLGVRPLVPWGPSSRWVFMQPLHVEKIPRRGSDRKYVSIPNSH